MARYDAGHKAGTRRRIIETAGRRFKQDGIDGSGVATLMTDAGLTNGAFYAHFDSKDDLVANVVADQLATQRAVLAALPEGRAALEEFVRDYLTPHHRDNPSTGCPSAALLDEIGRCERRRPGFLHRGNAIHRRRNCDAPGSTRPVRRSHNGAGAVHRPRRHHATRARRIRSGTLRRLARIRHSQCTDPAGPLVSVPGCSVEQLA